MEQPAIKPTQQVVCFNCPIELVGRINKTALKDCRTRSSWLLLTVKKALDELEKREQKT